jgi:transcriptional regulator with XRE-family HTH domain
MPMNDVPTGPTGARVAARVRELRQLRGYSLSALSQQMTKIGHPLSLDALHKIETVGADDRPRRRVDADALVALALALRVSPLALILPSADDGPVYVTDQVKLAFVDAWQWGTGEAPRPEDARSPSAVMEWLELTQPHRSRRDRSARWTALMEQR